MMLEEGLKIAGTMIQAIAIVVTAVIASKSLTVWRRQQLGKRKMEIAEEVLVAVYKARSNLRVVRSPVAWSGEGESRPKVPDESDAEAKWRSMHFVTFERMDKFRDDFAHFEKTKVLAQVHFGPNLTKALETIIGVYNEVFIAGRMLMSSRDERDLGPDFIRELRGKIWEHGGEDDKLKRTVDAAVLEVEEICRRHLK